MSDGRVKNSARNVLFGFGYQFLVLILSFVSRSVFIYTLGREFLGMNAIFADVLSLLSMADLGFGTAMAYSFYKPLADNDHEQIAKLIRFYKKVYNIIAIAVSVLGVLCVPFLKYIIKTEKDIPYLELYYLISLAGIVISYLFVYKTTLLTADQKNYKIVKIQMWTSVVKTILQIGFLLLLKNYAVYIAIGVIIQFINNLIASKKADEEYPYINDEKYKGDVDPEIQKSMFSNIAGVFVYKVSGILFNATDNVIISVVVGTAMAGVYSNYLMVSSKLLLIEQIIFSALTASVGNLIAKETAKKRLSVFNSMQSASFILCGVITSAFCILANDLIVVWLDGDFVLDTLTVIAITVNTYFSCVLQPLWIYRDATGLYKKTKSVMLIGAILNIVLSFALGYLIGIAGIIFASAIARLSTYFWYEPKLLFREYFDSSALKYYLALFANMIVVAGSVFVLGKATSFINVTGWGMLIVKGMIVGISCTIIFVLAYCRTEGFKMILGKAKGILKRK